MTLVVVKELVGYYERSIFIHSRCVPNTLTLLYFYEVEKVNPVRSGVNTSS